MTGRGYGFKVFSQISKSPCSSPHSPAVYYSALLLGSQRLELYPPSRMKPRRTGGVCSYGRCFSKVLSLFGLTHTLIITILCSSLPPLRGPISQIAGNLLGLLLLGLEVVVGTVGDGTTDEDDGVEADTEAAGGRGRGGGRRAGRSMGLGGGVTGLETCQQEV